MSKFNTSTIGADKTSNHEGALAYKMSPELELYSAVCTSTLSPQFYTPNTENTLNRIRDLIKQVSPDFVAKLAVYAREDMHLRSIPLVLVVELAKVSTPEYTNGLISSVTERVIQRPDEITEILGYYAMANNRAGSKKLGKLSNQLKKGISASFHKFNEYQFSKYNRKTDIRLRDALFLTHPKPKDNNEKELFRKIAEDTLEAPDTWEVKMSEAGKADTEVTTKKQVWEDMIDSGKFGFMAMLRNLRNIIEADVSIRHIEKVCDKLSNRDNVIKSKQFPFRFLSAYRMIINNSHKNSSIEPLVMAALEMAMVHSAENIPMFEGQKIKIASDVSGSMWSKISEKSTIEMYDIGIVLSMLLQHRCQKVITGIFGTSYLEQELPKNNILANSMKMSDLSRKVGWATNGHLIIEDAINKRQDLDRIMIFTDLQMWDCSSLYDTTSHRSSIKKAWSTYKKMYPKCKLYIFDLAGYGTSPLSIRDNDVNLIAGWSNDIFNIMSNIENGGETLDKINNICI